ncbi:MAG: tetratricopeptide repeat protein [Saprospiraceae bacterium]
MEIRLLKFGEYHPIIASSNLNIGATYQALGEFEKARTYIENAIKIWDLNFVNTIQKYHLLM